MSQNEIEDGAGLNQILSAAFGVQGAAAPFMASEVFPTLVMGNDRPEWSFLSGERRCQGFNTDAATAGQISHVGLNNNGQSGAIIVVDRIIVSDIAVGATRLFQIGMGIGAAIDTSTGQRFADTRLGFTATPTGDVYLLTQVARDGNSIYIGNLPANGTVTIDGPWILAPNGFIVVSANGVNTEISAGFQWREYSAADGELRNIATT